MDDHIYENPQRECKKKMKNSQQNHKNKNTRNVKNNSREFHKYHEVRKYMKDKIGSSTDEDEAVIYYEKAKI